MGALELEVPKEREGRYFPSMLEPRRRSERALLAVLQQAYVEGVSTRRVEDLVQALGCVGICKIRTRGVDGQRKCPPKWPAKMSLELLAMVSVHSVLTVGRFIGGLSACMYFFAVSRWMASSRATLRIDRPLRFAFCTAFHLAV